MEAVGREKEVNVKKGQDIHSYLYIFSDLNKHVSFYFYQKKCDFLFCVLKISLLMTTGKLWFSCRFTNLFQILLYQSNYLHTRLSVSHIPCVIFGEGLSFLWIPHSSEPPSIHRAECVWHYPATVLQRVARAQWPLLTCSQKQPPSQ